MAGLRFVCLVYSPNLTLCIADIFLIYHSLTSLDSMRDVIELLSDMLQAVNPRDREVCAASFLPE